jgi:hypothetical protein
LVGIDSIKHSGIEAGSALIADKFLNDLVGQKLLHGDNPIDFADSLRQGVIKAINDYGAAKDVIEIPVAGEMKDILFDGTEAVLR